MKANRRKKGFAIVLVAALAGFVFLLGASLVAVTRLQSAAANYDQRLRLAREHARAALEMAIGDLQQYAADDRIVTYTADVYRSDTEEDFKDGDSDNLREPFWAGAFRGTTENWLVTKALDGTVFLPTGEFAGDEIRLLGNGTVNSEFLVVDVPKEPIQVSGVSGFGTDDLKTIGHYGYWVGDSGVKASYALYDKDTQVLHDEYEGTSDDFRMQRLKQLRAAKPSMKIVDTDFSENPQRIEQFSNDFQFREDFGDTTTSDLQDDRFLIDLEEQDLEAYFQDFTPLSKGLLTNSNLGGFRSDLSTLINATTGTQYSVLNSEYLPFARSAKYPNAAATSYAFENFSITSGGSDITPIYPVLTQFNLNYSIYLEPIEGTSDYWLRMSFAAGFELWNPFASALAAQAIRFEVKGLPSLQIEMTPEWMGELGSLSKQPNFVTPDLIQGNGYWRPGQIVTYSGPEVGNAGGTEPYLLSESSAYVVDSENRVVIDDLEFMIDGYSSTPLYSFRNASGWDPASIEIEMYLDSTDELLATYSLDALEYKAQDITFNPLLPGVPTFGFSWEIDDSQVPHNVSYPPSSYHPFETLIDALALHDFNSISNGTQNKQPSFLGASDSLLLGSNPTETEETLNLIYDLSVFQLPKQELLSVANLSGAYGNSWQTEVLGEPGNALNAWFDEFYFSSVPQLDDGTKDWNIGSSIPNTGYNPAAGSSKLDLRANDSAEHLWVRGMFNVHSTSVDAWLALLKSCAASQSDYWNNYFEVLEGDEDDTLGEEVYLFFNFPLDAEDRFDASSSASTPIDQLRLSLSQSMVSFDEAQLAVLAKHIVSNIRKKLRGDLPYSSSGPFESLEAFVNSGVLNHAIADADLELGGGSVFKPSWVVEGTPRDFTQISLLNLIAPYLSVRSDTFLVRAYGDAVDPSDETKIWARAYCEAVVQRVHENHEESTLGRRMEVVAFRWLNRSEI